MNRLKTAAMVVVVTTMLGACGMPPATAHRADAPVETSGGAPAHVPDAGEAPVTPDAGAPELPDAGSTPSEPDAGLNCKALRTTRIPGGEAVVLAERFAQGGPVPTVQALGDDVLMLSSVQLVVPQPTAQATLTRLTANAGDPLYGHALEATLVNSGLPDTLTVVLRRVAPSANAPWFASPAAVVTLSLRAGQWRIAAVMVHKSVLYAAADELAVLTACSATEATPSEGPYQFDGEQFVMCAPTGTYHYETQRGDVVRWGAGLGYPDRTAWHWRGGRWQLLRPAHVIVAPANYWIRVQEADAMCGGVVGWELLIDVTNGAVVESKPGINCTTC